MSNQGSLIVIKDKEAFQIPYKIKDAEVYPLVKLKLGLTLTVSKFAVP